MEPEGYSSWAEMFDEARTKAGDDSPVIGWCATAEPVRYLEPPPDVHTGSGHPAGEWFARRFDAWYGMTLGCSFTIWSERRVYFPACYDGAEWVASVSRHPGTEPTDHIGG